MPDELTNMSAQTVPVVWFLVFLGIVLGGLISIWVWAFNRNENAHGRIRRRIRGAVRRLDHLIHHGNVPEFDDDNEDAE